jgi:hypothetical protein
LKSASEGRVAGLSASTNPIEWVIASQKPSHPFRAKSKGTSVLVMLRLFVAAEAQENGDER